MALPAVLPLLGKLAASAAVQRGAAKLVGDVYGKIMTPRLARDEQASASPTVSTDERLGAVIERLDAMATRDELIASFAALQAELDLRHRRASLLLAAVIATQAIVIALVLLT